MSDKLNLFSNEENELSFQLMIEGTTTDGSLSKPVVRFQIEDSDSGVAYSFPAITEGKEEIKVLIPPMERMVKEGKNYKGKLEVIIGTRYFVPTEVSVDFKKALRVESANVKVKHKSSTNKKTPGDSTPRVSSKIKTKVVSRKPKATKEQLELRKEAIRRKKLKEAARNKKAIKDKLMSALSSDLDDLDLDLD